MTQVVIHLASLDSGVLPSINRFRSSSVAPDDVWHSLTIDLNISFSSSEIFYGKNINRFQFYTKISDLTLDLTTVTVKHNKMIIFIKAIFGSFKCLVSKLQVYFRLRDQKDDPAFYG